MDQKNVLITGIGGNVGQGIIRNISALDYDIRIVGCNVTSFSAGNHLCDAFHKVPYSYEDNYIEEIQKVVTRESIDLILPSTDYEVYYLTKAEDNIPCHIVASNQATIEIYLDKYKTYLHHHKHGIPFAAAYLPSNYQGELSNIIVKQREGRGSRGLHFNPQRTKQFSDEYMVQELIEGQEITTAFYVTQKNKLHGFINFERKLMNGATNECTVTKAYNEQLESILNKIIHHSVIRGSANLQSIVTEDGDVIPFEVNCRISGTNSIRSNFGFEDVRYALEEYLYDIPISKPHVEEGTAVRILMDVIYPNQTDKTELADNSSEYYLF